MPAALEHVPGELRVLLVVVDDQDEHASLRHPMTSVAIRVVLADDHYLVARACGACSRREPELEVVAVCGDLDSLLAAVDAEQPDVVVTDIRMPPTGVDEGIQAAERLRETHPEIGVVVLSQYARARYALALLEGGTARPRVSAEGTRRRPRRSSSARSGRSPTAAR